MPFFAAQVEAAQPPRFQVGGECRRWSPALPLHIVASWQRSCSDPADMHVIVAASCLAALAAPAVHPPMLRHR